MIFKSTNTLRRFLIMAGGLIFAMTTMAPSCPMKYSFFKHKTHIVKEELECNDCHLGSDDGKQAGIPAIDICASCHEEAKEYVSVTDKMSKKWPRYKVLPADGIFSHKNHQDKEVNCDACHGVIAKNRKITFAQLPNEDTCLECHRKRSGATECSVCHNKINRETHPPSHTQAWERFHGQSARDPTQGQRCYRCHGRSTCTSCHSTSKPQDHTYSWTYFGHGVESRIDRSRCSTCHRSDYCIRCHQETPPRNHRAGWKSPSNRHCVDCHLGGGGNNCGVCHGGRSIHRSAPRKPRDGAHAVTTDCRSCHTGFLIKHPDNGNNCRFCHR